MTSTVCRGFVSVELEAMCLREFAETINRKWILNKNDRGEPVPSTSTVTRTFKTRDINSGHWELCKSRTRRHIRWSTVLYTEPTHLYEEVELGNTTSQTLYHDLPAEKRKQLYRAYQELVCYRAWKGTPDETFLTQEMRERLADPSNDPECESR